MESDTLESVRPKLSLTPMFCMDMEDLDTTLDTMDTLDMEVSSLDKNNKKACNTKTQNFQLIFYTYIGAIKIVQLFSSFNKS